MISCELSRFASICGAFDPCSIHVAIHDWLVLFFFFSGVFSPPFVNKLLHTNNLQVQVELHHFNLFFEIIDGHIWYLTTVNRQGTPTVQRISAEEVLESPRGGGTH